MVAHEPAPQGGGDGGVRIWSVDMEQHKSPHWVWGHVVAREPTPQGDGDGGVGARVRRHVAAQELALERDEDGGADPWSEDTR
jgi:hypothetical protein